MIAPKPTTLDYVRAASVPVIAVTAWQMLFEYANLSAGELCLVHGAAGNVGAYAVQLAHQKGIRSSRRPRRTTPSTYGNPVPIR
jgi:NADPH:quinone reductase-like Zn-dependent oxidoreductase